MIRKWVGGLLFLCLFCIVGCADGKTEKKPAAEYGKAMSEEKYETAYIEMTQEEKKKAGERITEVMEACRGIYESAEKGSADDVLERGCGAPDGGSRCFGRKGGHLWKL